MSPPLKVFFGPKVSFLLVKKSRVKRHTFKFRYTKPEEADDFDDDGCKSYYSRCFSNDFDDDAKKKRQRVVGLV